MLEIIVEDDVFVTENKSIVDTKIFIAYNNYYFPSDKWTDFTFPILEEWKHNMLNVLHSENISFNLYFHDGPFWLEIFKNEKMELKIDCINDRTVKKTEISIHCGYYEFLECMNSAFKSFIKILYKNKMNLGDFTSVYRQSISSQNEIKNLLKERGNDF